MKAKRVHKNNDLLIVIGEHCISSCQSSILQITDFDWNAALTPWPAKAIRKGESDFSGRASELVKFIQSFEISNYEHVYVCGYSLAGLFALYACIILDLDGCACCSASFWYPEFVSFVKKHPVKNKQIYLSLGSKESKSRNVVLASVKACTEEIYKTLEKENRCTFEMNPGNHFDHVEERMQKGIAWLENGV